MNRELPWKLSRLAPAVLATVALTVGGLACGDDDGDNQALCRLAGARTGLQSRIYRRVRPGTFESRQRGFVRGCLVDVYRSSPTHVMVRRWLAYAFGRIVKALALLDARCHELAAVLLCCIQMGCEIDARSPLL